jgi:ribosomal protein S17
VAFAVFTSLTPHSHPKAKKLLRNFQALPAHRPQIQAKLDNV